MDNVKTSLVRKVAICIGLIFVLLLSLILFASQAIVLSGFQKLEKQDVQTNLTRAQHSINNEINGLARTCGDWAIWDDARDYVLGKKSDFVTANITMEVLSNLELNFMIYLDKEGKIVHSSVVDYVNKTDANLPEGLEALLLSKKLLANLKEPEDCKTGIVIVSDIPVLVAAQPITNNNRKKPINGMLILGRYLDNNVIEKLRKNTCLDIKITKKEI